jgi:hypothetical protein
VDDDNERYVRSKRYLGMCDHVQVEQSAVLLVVFCAKAVNIIGRGLPKDGNSPL